jgi:HAD superfamily hydrolase (TIGR01509 family)
MIRALIFDFDGLIFDTETPEFQSWQETFQSFGCHFPFEKWAMVIGSSNDHFDPLAELEQQLGRVLDNPSQLEEKRMQRELEILGTCSAQPGVEFYLKTAKQLGLKMGLASCSSGEWVRKHLTRLGLIPFFESIRTREDVKLVKPGPELYLRVLSDLAVTAAEAIAFEDSPNGITAARQAGLYCVAVPNPLTSQLNIGHADLQLTSLEEMPLEKVIWMASQS